MALDLSTCPMPLQDKHTLMECTCERNEMDRCTASFIMPWDDVFSLNGIQPGENPPSFLEHLPYSNLRVETVSITREEGGVAHVSMTMVRASDKTSPYHYTVNVDYPEVQKPLVSHPLLAKDQEALLIFKKWLQTPEAVRVGTVKNGNKTDVKFYYQDYDSDGTVKDELTEMKNEMALKFARAHAAGIESFNQYLPVIEVTSQYLRLPGVDVDEETHEITGTLDKPDKLGEYCEPPFSIDGYDKHLWFKSIDKVSQNGNGTWSRTEQYVCTNDLRFKWIYENNDSTKIIEDK